MRPINQLFSEEAENNSIDRILYGTNVTTCKLNPCFQAVKVSYQNMYKNVELKLQLQLFSRGCPPKWLFPISSDEENWLSQWILNRDYCKIQFSSHYYF